MYIAFKWLVSLAFAMWLAMCSKDLMFNKIKKERGKAIQFEFTFKNVSELKSNNILNGPEVNINYNKEQSMTAVQLYFTIFIAGALAISALNKKNEIITFTRRNVAKIIIRSAIRKQTCFVRKSVNLKYPAIKIGAAVAQCFFTIWKEIKLYKREAMNYLRINTLKACKSFKQLTIYNAMLSKLRDIGNERKNLSKLLISAIQENKNIRMQYQLETYAKNRLVKNIENTRKQIKENTSRYMNFQHLYLITHKENIFLRSRIVKLTKEKEAVEKNLMGLISDIYKTKNNELKAHCSRYIVKTTNNLLNSDVHAEIETFLKKSQHPSYKNKLKDCENSYSDTASVRGWPVCFRTPVSEIIRENNNIVSLISDAPKLKGLPGEYVWTVKDKDGIIEKLFEYDYESDFDSGDTIRRIRQYSVYYDKDCLLDFTNSVTENEVMGEEDHRCHFHSVEHPLGSLRIVSGSEAFKKFLRSHKNSLASSSEKLSSTQ